MIPEVFVNVGVNFQVNPCLRRTCDIGQNRLNEFCYLLPFDMWIFYLARILFLKGCESLFWEFTSSTRIFNELQYNLQVWQVFINVSESFPYKDSLSILTTQGKKGLRYDSSFTITLGTILEELALLLETLLSSFTLKM